MERVLGQGKWYPRVRARSVFFYMTIIKKQTYSTNSQSCSSGTVPQFIFFGGLPGVLDSEGVAGK